MTSFGAYTVALFAALLLTVLPAAAETGGTPACAAAPAGQRFWLRGDGNLDDATGYHNGGAGGTVDIVPGKVGRALNFTNQPDHVGVDVTIAEMRAVRDNFS